MSRIKVCTDTYYGDGGVRSDRATYADWDDVIAALEAGEMRSDQSIQITREESGSLLEEMAERVEVQHIHNFDKERVEINWVNLRPWMMAISKRVDQISKGED